MQQEQPSWGEHGEVQASDPEQNGGEEGASNRTASFEEMPGIEKNKKFFFFLNWLFLFLLDSFFVLIVSWNVFVSINIRFDTVT